MTDGLDVIIVDDDEAVCSVLAAIVKTFYVWGDVLDFNDVDQAVSYCRQKKEGVAIFILDVFLGKETGFGFLDTIAEKFPMAHGDTIIITGNASADVVNMCIASNITYLIEKPIHTYTLQFAIRAIVAKYIRFAKRLLEDPVLAESVRRFSI